MEGTLLFNIRRCSILSHACCLYQILAHELFSFLNKRANNPNRIGGSVTWDHPDRNSNPVNFAGTSGNPPIEFDADTTPNILLAIPTGRASVIDPEYFPTNANEEIIVTRRLTNAECASLGEPGVPVNPVFAFYRGNYYIHDPRFVRHRVFN